MLNLIHENELGLFILSWLPWRSNLDKLLSKVQDLVTKMQVDSASSCMHIRCQSNTSQGIIFLLMKASNLATIKIQDAMISEVGHVCAKQYAKKSITLGVHWTRDTQNRSPVKSSTKEAKRLDTITRVGYMVSTRLSCSQQWDNSDCEIWGFLSSMVYPLTTDVFIYQTLWSAP